MTGRTDRDHGHDRAELGRPAFVGRDHELAQLQRVLSGPRAVVLVEGEAGIGKSRLVQEFIDARRGEGRPGHGPATGRTLLAGCPPFREPFTLGPVVDALRAATDQVGALRLTALAGVLRPMFPEWADTLPPAPEPLDDATAARHRLFRALAEVLDRLEVGLLVVEDLHWADQATLEFLLFLGARRPAGPSLALTYRPEDVPVDSLLRRLTSAPAAGAERLRLSLRGLDVADTGRLLSSMLAGESPSAEFTRFMHSRTDGVPLAIEESVRLLRDRKDLTRRDGEWVRRHLDRIDVPPTIRDSVVGRLARLGNAARAVLEAAAVLTDATDEATLAAVSDLSAGLVRAGLGDALAAGMLQRTERHQVMFRHVLTGRSVYEAIPDPDRRLLHLRTGQVLEQRSNPPLAALARHFREAADTERWCRYAEQAADLALKSGDEATAVALLHDVAVRAELPGRVVARLTDKISFSTLAGPQRYRALAHALESALAREALAPADEGEIRYQLARVLGGLEEYAASADELERAVPKLTHNPVLAARAMLSLSHPRGTERPVASHLHWLRRAAEVIESMVPADQLSARVDRAVVLLLLGEAEGWTEAARIPDLPTTAREHNHINRAQVNLSHAATVWGDYPEARRRLELARALTDAQRYQRARDMIMVNEAHLDWFTGRWEGLAERVEALAGNDDLQPVSRLEPLLIAAQLEAAAGLTPSTETRLRHVYAETRRYGALAEMMEPAAALARLHLDAGRPDEALRVTDEPAELLTTKEVWIWAADLGPVRTEALIGTGHTDVAEQLVADFGRGLRGRTIPAARAALVTCRALVLAGRGDHGRAAQAFVRVARAWEQLPRPYVALRAREYQARSLLAADRTEAGVAVLSEVFQGYASLGARGDAIRLLPVLRKYGVEAKRPWWGGRKGYGDQLSPRELEVARLVAAGHTNREIAAALSRSPHTVATQLNSAMRKLGVSTRTALAVTAVEAGLLPTDGRTPG